MVGIFEGLVKKCILQACVLEIFQFVHLKHTEFYGWCKLVRRPLSHTEFYFENTLIDFYALHVLNLVFIVKLDLKYIFEFDLKPEITFSSESGYDLLHHFIWLTRFWICLFFEKRVFKLI